MVYILMKNKQGEKVGGQVVKGIKLASPDGTHYTVTSTHRRGINKYEIKMESESGSSRSAMNYEIGHNSDWTIRGSFHTPEELAKIFGKSKVDPDANKPRHERESFWTMRSKPGTHNYKQKMRLIKDQPEKYKKYAHFLKSPTESEKEKE